MEMELSGPWGPFRRSPRAAEADLVFVGLHRASRHAEVEELFPFVLVRGERGDPADRHVRRRGVGEAEDVLGIRKYPERPRGMLVVGRVEEPDARNESAVERAFVEVPGVGPFPKVEPATAPP